MDFKLEGPLNKAFTFNMDTTPRWQERRVDKLLVHNLSVPVYNVLYKSSYPGTPSLPPADQTL